MKRLFFLFIGAFLLSLISACSSNSRIEPDFDFVAKPGDKLTLTEMNVLKFHAKQFICQSKKIKITDAQRKLIRSNDPRIKVKYLGHKYGRIDFEWTIAPNTVLILTTRGHLRNDKQNWSLQIKTTTQTNPVPEGFLKEDMTYMALPPK